LFPLGWLEKHGGETPRPPLSRVRVFSPRDAAWLFVRAAGFAAAHILQHH
jgi:hypothetical protein